MFLFKTRGGGLGEEDKGSGMLAAKSASVRVSHCMVSVVACVVGSAVRYGRTGGPAAAVLENIWRIFEMKFDT